MTRKLIGLVIVSVLCLNVYSQTNTLTNKQYREFTGWVRDSVTRMHFANNGIPEFKIEKDASGKFLQNPVLNWEKQIDFSNALQSQLLNELLNSKWELVNGERGFQSSKMVYVYLQNGQVISTNIYPDTLCWVKGQLPLDTLPYLAYTSHEGKTFYCNRFGTIYDALAATYFWHPYFDNYSVVGLNDEQLRAYSHWCSTVKKPAQYSKFTFSSSNNSIELKDLSISHWVFTQKEYSEFANWVADSIAMRQLGHTYDEFLISEDKFGNEIDPPMLNWKAQKQLKGSNANKIEDITEILLNLYNPKTHLYNKYKVKYEYCVWDFVRATNYSGWSRGDFISRDLVMVFPNLRVEDSYKDTIAWGNLSQIKITELNYNNAYAYYNWLQYYSNKLKLKKTINPVSFYLLPNRDEWDALKAIEKIASLSYNITLPTPLVLTTN